VHPGEEKDVYQGKKNKDDKEAALVSDDKTQSAFWEGALRSQVDGGKGVGGSKKRR
jgi:hypothetical protein